jgi:hypothetical protein
MNKVNLLIALGFGLVLCLGWPGCAGIPDRFPGEAPPDAGDVTRPDAVSPPADARPPDTRVASPDARLAPDAQPMDVYVSPRLDALPWSPEALPADVRAAGLDALPPVPDAGYVNQYGWTPYLADGSEAPCCITCGDYDGCLVRIHTTPFCTITIGSDCFQGGTGDKSVWPTCRKPPATGCRPWTP